ncbi:hypothetical protein GQ53DRAFT_642601 [Thozetella sp. PMI_491]|nr:hypothetical protein GQ53DRAFT_642601 [Thozetella sp. PMI_491]
MSAKPIFMATHPRACSTAFERVFMTRRDELACLHEPFGDAFYYGPERLGERFEGDDEARGKSGFAQSTYRTIMDLVDREGSEQGKRVFIKDMAYYLVPPDGKPARPAPSLRRQGGSETPGTNGLANGANGTGGGKYPVNPSVMPTDLLKKFHWTFLIRHPRRAIPSYYRCTVPPLKDVTGFHEFMPNEAGYEELRRLFDYLKDEGIVGPVRAGEQNGASAEAGDGVSITVVDADDLLDQPAKMVEAFCREVGLEYSLDMLKWGDDENQQYAANAFAKWIGFHNDAISSTSLRARTHALKAPSPEQEDQEWRKKFGDHGQKTIRQCVDANVEHYEYLKRFAIQV